MMTCEKCGHENPFQNTGAALVVEEVPKWEWMVNAKTQEVLKNRTTGREEGTVTLYVSRTTGINIADQFAGKKLSDAAAGTFSAEVAPVLNKITETFEVVGAMATPCWMPLAVISLEVPAAVFCFVTIKAVDNLKQKLADAGLSTNLLNPNMGTTIYGASLV